MRRTLFTTFWSTLTLLCWGQPKEELNAMKVKYSDQPAVYEHRSEAIEITYSKKEGLNFEVSANEQLFILTNNALPFSKGIEYYSKSFNLEKINAYTLIPGEKGYTQMEVKDFNRTSEIDDNVFFDDQQALNFTFPAVCQGAKLVENTKFKHTKPEYPMSFFFETGIPTVAAKFSITFPENVKINYKLFGADTTMIRLTKSKKGKKWIYSWDAENTKCQASEANSPNVRYYATHIVANVESITDEKGISPVIGSLADFYRINYSRIKEVNKTISPEIKLLADSITAGIVEEREKVSHIFEWVQKNIRYVAIEDGDNGVVPREADLVLHRRYGDCKDKTSIIYAMLTAIGADASFAWIGTRNLPYKYSEFPSTIVDNHMIAVYRNPSGKAFFLDGTTLYHTMDLPPVGIQGKECLVSRGNDKFDLLTVPIAPPEANAIIDSVWVEVKHDTLMGKGAAYFVGESKSNVIAAFLNSAKDDYPSLFTRILPKASNKLKINQIEVSNLSRIEDTLKVTYSFTLPSYISLRGKDYYINLNLDKVLQNETVKSDRTIPIEFDFPATYRSVCTFIPPSGYLQPQLPGERSFTNSMFGFNISYAQMNGSITLSKELFSKEILLFKENFESYRKYLSELNEAYMQTILFRKN